MPTIETDVCIVGAGPAGSAVARRLADLGHDVVLVEAKPFPRPRIAATLPFTILPLLKQLGVREAIEAARFPRAMPPRVMWPGELAARRPEAHAAQTGLHVDRALFDSLMLEHAKAAGVRLIQPAFASLPTRRNGCNRWATVLTVGGSHYCVRSRLFIDASGRQRGGSGGNRTAVPTVALYAYWDRGTDDDESCIEARYDAWAWCAPVSDRTVLATVFIDRTRLPRRDPRGIKQVYDELLAQSELVGSRLGTQRRGDVLACDATSRYASLHAAPDFLKVGDASLTLDPLSSQGVQQAIASALQAAIVANTALRRPACAAMAARFYTDRQNERGRQHQRMARSQYEQVARHYQTPFWVERALFGREFDEPLRRQAAAANRDSPLDLTYVRLARDVAIAEIAAIEDAYVTMKKGILNKNASPIVYVDGVEIADLLERTALGRPAAEVVADWSKRFGSRRALSIFVQLVRFGVLTEGAR